MIRTFNCGVGFCLIAPRKNILKIKKNFQKNLNRTVGFISKDKKKSELMGSLK